MHPANRAFWKHCEHKYEPYFHKDGGRILEVGCRNENGTVREHFHNFSEYLGVDWRAGEGVDKVCLAHEMDFNHKFDVVISASMLEHDRHWSKSIPKMIEFLEDDGILLLSWGAALNKVHCLEASDDGGFYPLPAYYVFKTLEELGIYIHEFRYERLQFPKLLPSHDGAGMGEVSLVGFKDKTHAIGEQHLDQLIEEDTVPL